MEETVIARALHRKVLIVYVVNAADWAAYCVPVNGINHENEKHTWPVEGNKLSEAHARALYPGLATWADSQSANGWRH